MPRLNRFAIASIGTVLVLAFSYSDSLGLIAAQDEAPQDKAPKDKQGGEKKDGQPKSRLGLILNTPKAFKGYTLFSPLSSTKFYLIDMEGRVVKQWEGAATPASSAYLLENGNVMRPCAHNEPGKKGGGPAGGRVQVFTWDSEIVWDFKIPYSWQQHHDVIRLPNGNYLILGWDRKTAEETAAAGRKGGGSIMTDILREVRPTGKTTGDIVWEWRVWDYLIQDVNKDKANFGEVAKHPELIDINFNAGGGGKGGGGQEWTHTNALSYNAKLDQIMISVSLLNEVWIIDHSTTTEEAKGHKGGKYGKGGDLLYRWGNPAQLSGRHPERSAVVLPTQHPVDSTRPAGRRQPARVQQWQRAAGRRVLVGG